MIEITIACFAGILIGWGVRGLYDSESTQNKEND